MSCRVCTFIAISFAAVTLHVSPVVGQELFWTNFNTDFIQRANLDGSNLENLAVAGLVGVSGIAIDASAAKMYFCDTSADKICRAELDGSSVEDLVTTDLVTPYFIALDVAAGKMYWTDPNNGLIKRADLDGSNVTTILSAFAPAGIALDTSGGKLYYTDLGTGEIFRADLDGSDVELLATTTVLSPISIALDVAAGMMYWSDHGTNSIRRAGMEIPEGETAINRTDFVDVVTLVDFVSGIAIDLAAGKLYFAKTSGERVVRRVDLNGSNIEDIATGLSNPFGVALIGSETPAAVPICSPRQAALMMVLILTAGVVIIGRRQPGSTAS